MTKREKLGNGPETNETLGEKLIRMIVEGFESYGNTAGMVERAYWFGEVEPREEPVRPPQDEI